MINGGDTKTRGQNLKTRMNVERRIQILVALGRKLNDLTSDFWLDKIDRCRHDNGWFTKESVVFALENIRDSMLQEDLLRKWGDLYSLTEKNIKPKKIGLVLAGNIPLVGFHDVITVFVSGHIALIKKSEKDSILMQTMMELMEEEDEEVKSSLIFVDRLTDMEAVIATGSNNSARYFESYFAKLPHIIRKNRNSVGVVYADTSMDTIRAMGRDIFTYYGLGCRNVSKLLIARNYKLENIMESLHDYNEVNMHHKYHNNFDFNIAVNMLNRQHYLNNGSVMLCEDPSLASRIATLNFEYFEDEADLENKLLSHASDLQCIVSEKALPYIKTILPGKTQQPSLWDYADDVDTMQFLIKL